MVQSLLTCLSSFFSSAFVVQCTVLEDRWVASGSSSSVSQVSTPGDVVLPPRSAPHSAPLSSRNPAFGFSGSCEHPPHADADGRTSCPPTSHRRGSSTCSSITRGLCVRHNCRHGHHLLQLQCLDEDPEQEEVREEKTGSFSPSDVCTNGTLKSPITAGSF